MPTLEALEQKYFVSDPNGPNRAYRGADSDVQALVDGKEYFAVLSNAISKTQGPGDAIYVVSWVFSSSQLQLDHGVDPLRDLLVAKAEKGVDVRLLFWTEMVRVCHAYPTAKWFVSSGERNATMAEGIDLRLHNPNGLAAPPLQDRVLLDWSAPGLGSHHQKSVVVIHSHPTQAGVMEIEGFVSGMDLVDYVVASPGHADQPWHDLGVVVRGPAASSVLSNFRDRWNTAASLPRDADVWIPRGGLPEPFPTIPESIESLPPAPTVATVSKPSATTTSLQVVQTFAKNADPWQTAALKEGRGDIRATLERAISQASRYIYVEDQYIGSEEGRLPVRQDVPYGLLTKRLRESDAVKVILVARGESAWDEMPDEFNEPAFGSRLAVWRLDGRKSRSTPFGLKTVFPPIMVHSKLVVIDDEFAMVGSANFANRSLVVDDSHGTDSELSVAVVSNGTWVRDLRLALWTEHLAPTPVGPDERPELESLDTALGIWRTGWETTPPAHLATARTLTELAARDSRFDPSTPRVLLRYLGPGGTP